MTRMTLEQFNSAEEDAAERLLLACAAVPRWARAVAAGRPYASRDALLDAAHSRREQSGVDTSDADVAERLRAGNRAYEERFGHVFLIRAAGRSAAEILSALDERLGNDPATERRVVAEQLREIAVLRLEKELA